MSNPVVSAAVPQNPKAAAASAPLDVDRATLILIHRSWKMAITLCAIMLVLALLGVALTTNNSAFAPTYWVMLVPVYGVFCVANAWNRKRHGQESESRVVLRQVLHWLGIGVALGLDFFIRGSGQESGLVAGLNALMLLALGCFLAGVHLEWLFAVVGVLLTLLAIAVVKLDQYSWLIFVVGGLAVAGLVWLRWHIGKKHSTQPAMPAAAPARS